MTELLKDFEDIFEGDPWHGDPLLPSIKKIPVEIINLKPTNSAHSIAELIEHLISWRTLAIMKLRGDKDFNIEMNSEQDWKKNVNIKNENEFNELLQRLQETQVIILAELKSKNKDWLTQKTQGKNYTNGFLIQGILYHDVYHLGQINFLHGQLTRSIKN